MTAKRPHLTALLLALSIFQAERASASSFSGHRRISTSFVVPSSTSTDVSKKHHGFLRDQERFVESWRYRSNKDRQRISIITPTYMSSPQDEDTSEKAKINFGTGQTSFNKYGRPQDINESSFGPLLPIAEAVDEATGGWGLSYADLHPATPQTTVGQVFLATNFFYAAAGLWLGINGDWFYGGLTELAGIVSFVYHYTQLEFGKNRSEVRLALLVDYFCAGSALITGGVYMIQAGITSIPMEALLSAGGAVITLSLCWVWEFGYPYIFWHSLWHILSAYTGYLVGQEHLDKIAGV